MIAKFDAKDSRNRHFSFFLYLMTSRYKDFLEYSSSKSENNTLLLPVDCGRLSSLLGVMLLFFILILVVIQHVAKQKLLKTVKLN